MKSNGPKKECRHAKKKEGTDECKEREAISYKKKGRVNKEYKRL